MSALPVSMQELIRLLSKMPGVGPRTAERYAFYILRSSRDTAESIAKAITTVKSTVRFCAVCNNLSDSDLCHICKSNTRNRKVLCVVEEPNDVITIEKSGHYDGIYHVLLGSLSPLEGIGPHELKISDLIDRVQKEAFQEIVLATNFSSEGETTSLYLQKALRDFRGKISRIAHGIPVGANLSHADQATITKAFEGRRTLERD